MKTMNTFEMRQVEGGFRYYCQKCKSFCGWNLFDVGLHVIFAHGGNKNSEKFVIKKW